MVIELLNDIAIIVFYALQAVEIIIFVEYFHASWVCHGCHANKRFVGVGGYLSIRELCLQIVNIYQNLLRRDY